MSMAELRISDMVVLGQLLACSEGPTGLAWLMSL